MTYFCTLFDSHYLTRGLALYNSLVKTGDAFHLFVFCFDALTHDLLSKIALNHATLIRLQEFETPELLAIKEGRTTAEYCWTCTPHIIHHVLQHEADRGVREVTYVDADLYFFNKPSVLLDELHTTECNVLLTSHRYSSKYDQSATSGKFCVQFMTFNDRSDSKVALEWWKERCTEWCYNRFEDGKFGDQKYLDDWLERFNRVHVLQHLGGGVAPWNVQQYTVGPGPSVNGVPIVFYHFHHLKWYSNGYVDLAGNYKLPGGAIEYIYRVYLNALKEALEQVRKVQPEFDGGIVSPEVESGLKTLARKLKKKIAGNYNVIRI